MNFAEVPSERVLTNAITSDLGEYFLSYTAESDSGQMVLRRVDESEYLKALDQLGSSPAIRKREVAREVIGGFEIGGIVILKIQGEKAESTFQRITKKQYEYMQKELNTFGNQLESLTINSAQDIDPAVQEKIEQKLENITSSTGIQKEVIGSLLLSMCEKLWTHKRSVLTATVLAIALHAGYVHQHSVSGLHKEVVAQITLAQESIRSFPQEARSIASSLRDQVSTIASHDITPVNFTQSLQAASQKNVEVEVPVLRKKGGLRIEQETQSFSVDTLAKYAAQATEVIETRFTPQERDHIPSLETILSWALKESSLREKITGAAGEKGTFQVGDGAFGDVVRSLSEEKRSYDLMDFEDNLFVALKYYLLKHREMGKFLSHRGYETGKNISPDDFEALIFATYNRGAGHMMGLLEGYFDVHGKSKSFHWKNFSEYWLQKAESANSEGNTYIVFPKTNTSGKGRSPTKNHTMHVPTVYIMCQYPRYIQECSQELLQFSQVGTQSSKIAA